MTIINSYFKQFLRAVNGAFPVESARENHRLFSGIEFLWRCNDILYFDLLGIHAAWACDSRFCSVAFMATIISQETIIEVRFLQQVCNIQYYTSHGSSQKRVLHNSGHFLHIII
jgi:hypothetical protein